MKKLLYISSLLAISIGVVLVFGGLWAVVFTYQNVSQENIITPEDASIPNAPVRGPFTLHSQANVIRKHTLKSTNGQTYAEMPRQIPKIDEDGDPVLDKEGNPVMVANETRNMWITATALITALHLAIITYLFSGLISLLGFISIWTGIVFGALNKKYSR